MGRTEESLSGTIVSVIEPRLDSSGPGRTNIIFFYLTSGNICLPGLRGA
jgi:hypothetical protein